MKTKGYDLAVRISEESPENLNFLRQIFLGRSGCAACSHSSA